MIEPPDLLETKMAIQPLKSNKATGIDNIPSEIYKPGGEFLKIQKYELIAKIWETEVIPKEWCNSIPCPIYKKGDKLNCKTTGTYACCAQLIKYLLTF
jgi:hypothetical protein